MATGEVNTKQAVGILATYATIALGCAYMINPLCAKLGALIAPFALAYPLSKRVFPCPQLPLGFICNFGVFIGYAAIAGSLNYSVCIPMYIGAILHTLISDTIYGFQDIEGDKAAGAYSCAIFFENCARTFFTV